MLTGDALLELVKTNPTMPKDELMKVAGYVVTREDGRTTMKTSDFMSAILEAQGINLTPAKTSAGAGRQPTFRTSCMKNGNIVIGKGYFERVGAEAGDAFEVVVENKKITLKPTK